MKEFIGKYLEGIKAYIWKHPVLTSQIGFSALVMTVAYIFNKITHYGYPIAIGIQFVWGIYCFILSTITAIYNWGKLIVNLLKQ